MFPVPLSVICCLLLGHPSIPLPARNASPARRSYASNVADGRSDAGERTSIQLLSRTLHLPIKVCTRRISTPAFPTASLHTAGHADEIGGIRCACGGDIGIGNGGTYASLAPFSIQGAVTSTRVLCPACGDGIIVVSFGVDDSCGVSGDAGGEIDGMRVGAVTLCT